MGIPSEKFLEILAEDVLLGSLLGCPSCGLIGEYRTEMTRFPGRGGWLRCAGCGSLLARLIPPQVRMPWGKHAGEWVYNLEEGYLDWLHTLSLHPWIKQAVCWARGCQCPSDPHSQGGSL